MSKKFRVARIVLLLCLTLYMGWQWFVSKGGTEIFHEGRNEEITERLENAGLQDVTVSSEINSYNNEMMHSMRAEFQAESPESALRAYENLIEVREEQLAEGRNYQSSLTIFLDDDRISLSRGAPEDILPLLLEHADQGTLHVNVSTGSLSVSSKNTPLEVYAPLFEDVGVRFPELDTYTV